MSIFDLDAAGQQSVAEEAANKGVTLDQIKPTFFQGAGKATGEGIMRGGAKVGDFLATIGSFFDEPGIDHTATDQLQNDIRKNAIDYWTPQANEVGTAGRVLGGAAEMVLPLMLTAGNPGLMLGSQSISTGKDLVDQGVSPGAATAVATTEAAAGGIGFKLPFLGSTLASRVGTGVAGNVALGVASREANNAILDASGNPIVADQYKPLDREAAAIDAIMGAAFGGLAHVTSPSVKPSHVDAALTANNAKHFQSDTAPGTPADINASVAHQDALESAMKSILQGEPVSVGHTGVTDATFVPRESAGAAEVPTEYKALDQTSTAADQPPELAAIPADTSLAPIDQAIETSFREQIQRDPQGAMDAYAKLPDAGGGKIINTDIARELSPDYLKDRTKSAAVHEPASALMKALYSRMLGLAPKPGEEPLVVFSAGGTGAGKTTGLELTGLDRKAQIVYDSNMNSMDSAVKRIDQALDAGKQVQILYTYRDPVEALTGGALPRAMRQEREHGTGRTIPLKKHADTHIGSAKVLHQLAEKYANDPRVNISVVDNSLGKGQARLTDLSVVPKSDQAHNGLEGKLNEALDQQFQAGKISESVYRGFKGEPATTGQAVQPEGVQRPADERGSGNAKPASTEGRLNPIISAAHQAAEVDFQVPTVDADGNTTGASSAKQLLEQAHQDVVQATQDARGFDAAVNCFLANGN